MAGSRRGRRPNRLNVRSIDRLGGSEFVGVSIVSTSSASTSTLSSYIHTRNGQEGRRPKTATMQVGECGHEFVAVQPSQHHGRGLFATRAFAPGEVSQWVWVYR